MATEFDIISRYFAFSKASDTATSNGVVLGIGDDAAVLELNQPQLLVATDTLVSGVHFPADALPAAIASRALAVNLSDFAAMGAVPRWLTLALTLPNSDENWLQQFSAALAAGCANYDLALVGGDTTRGPLTVTLSVMGNPPASAAPLFLRRDAARAGDDLWVSGVLGAGAAALHLLEQQGVGRQNIQDSTAIDDWQPGSDIARLLEQHFYAPTPRLQLGQALLGVANAAIDISDGLLADAGHIARASGVGLILRGPALPLHAALASLSDRQLAQTWALAGGDDYELLFSAPAQQRDTIAALASRVGVPCTLVGAVTAGEGVALDGEGWALPGKLGYSHF